MNIGFLSILSKLSSYSTLSTSTGFNLPARMVWNTTVAIAINRVKQNVIINILYENLWYNLKGYDVVILIADL